MNITRNGIAGLLVFLMNMAIAQENWEQKFEQLGTMLPTPNTYRTASGAPGHQYWQMQADYKMDLTLNDNKQTLSGEEQITYHNNSPNQLEYLWVQLDQNMRAQDSNTPLVRESKIDDTLSVRALHRYVNDFEGGFNIEEITDEAGSPLSFSVHKTMMRINLEKPLAPGNTYSFNIKWWYNINDRMAQGGRSGMEFFPKDGNYLYTIAQFYPRMAVYSDVDGWQNKQFLGRGEFALPFGDFEVSLTVPSDFIVGATGTLQNEKEVLTSEQIRRFEEARKSFEKPVIIVTEKEAIQNEKKKASGQKTWTYKAKNVRDFAFVASRKLIWDAMAVDLDGSTPLAMSYYPKEGNPLWEEYSTLAVRQTLLTYSKHTIPYPYPVAISAHSASIGMEYPMICFNYGRPDEDGSYSERLKYGMISVIIHEVGHNFFPMIINSDERQWTWMDEGLNSFVQYLTEQEWDPNYPSRRGPASRIVPYMRGDRGEVRPIMTNSEQILQFGSNAYSKPATALNILRETVMGPELFDYAFKKYAERWAFKHPTPADLFRTMEDASAFDLDWFWRGWFYSTDNVDVSIENVKWFRMQSTDDKLETRTIKAKDENIRSEDLKDFASSAETFFFQGDDNTTYREFRNNLDQEKIKSGLANKNFYEITFANQGGLVTPLLIEWTYADGSKELNHIPAEIWRMNEQQITKVFVKEKKVVNILLDPERKTADVDVEDNYFPRTENVTRFDKFKNKK